MSFEQPNISDNNLRKSYKFVLPAAIAAFLAGHAVGNGGEDIEKELGSSREQFAELLNPETVEKLQEMGSEIEKISRSEYADRMYPTPIGRVTFSFAPDQSFVLSRKMGSDGTVDHVYKIEGDRITYAGGKNLDGTYGEPHSGFSVSYKVDGYEGNYKLENAQVYDEAENPAENLDEDIGTDLLVINWINNQKEEN